MLIEVLNFTDSLDQAVFRCQQQSNPATLSEHNARQHCLGDPQGTLVSLCCCKTNLGKVPLCWLATVMVIYALMAWKPKNPGFVSLRNLNTSLEWSPFTSDLAMIGNVTPKFCVSVDHASTNLHAERCNTLVVLRILVRELIARKTKNHKSTRFILLKELFETLELWRKTTPDVRPV